MKQRSALSSFFRHWNDNDRKQRRDIDHLQDQLENLPDHLSYILELQGRAGRLELVCQALMELLIAKGVCTQEELDVLMLQIDLSDGLEDGKLNPQVREDAPRCDSCDRFVSLRHSSCVYCGASIKKTSDQRKRRPAKLVSCVACTIEVPENRTYFTAEGVQCAECFKSYSADF